nr:uncharacterized protein LOC109164726 [Ipomoea batatas]
MGLVPGIEWRVFLVRSAYGMLINSQKESLDYLFWKCKEVSRICERLLPWNVAKKLRSMEWEEWLSMNLKGDAHVGFDDGWPATFGIGMWWIWRWWIDAEEADAWAVLQDMCMARSNGPWKLIIECDSNSMIECLRGNMRTYGRWRNIMRACLIELQGFDKSEVSSYLSRAEHCC